MINIFKLDKILDRLDRMIDHAMYGQQIENDFDETKMSALETKLNKYLKMTKASRAKLAEEKAQISELVSDISHQTKTPVANILLYSQLLQESELSEQDKQCVDSLVEQAQKLDFLVASLVKSSRLETGIVSLSSRMQPLNPLLEGAVAQISTAASSKNINVTCESTDIHAVFDLKWSTEAVYNIIDNAVKYTDEGGTVSITVFTYHLFCRIDIRDTGIGIGEHEIAKIFSRFYRSTDVSDKEGVGIGLHLAREIIMNEGGYIKVKSEVGKGSTFSIFLPMSY